MPWCVGCDRFLSPSTVNADGTCPRCGAVVDPGRARSEVGAEAHPLPQPAPPAPASTGPDDAEQPLPLPWHFKLLVGAIALYLGWRAFQGVEWVIHRL